MQEATRPFAEVMAGLRREFEAGLPDRAAEIRKHAPAALAGDPAALAALRVPVHALAGTGATFGHPAISDAALALENMMDQPDDLQDTMPAGLATVLNILDNTIKSGGGT